jgi:hypothetical protein
VKVTQHQCTLKSEYLLWFHGLAIVDSVAINMGVQLSVLYADLTSVWLYPQDHIVSVCSVF